MKAVAVEVHVRDFLVTDFPPDRIRCGIELRPNLQTCRGGGCRDQVDNNLVADQRLAAPVLADEGEKTVLNLVPFAGTRRKVAHRNRHLKLVSQLLKLYFPQTDSRSVAATTIRGDQ